ncbi:hypothetical protein [Cellulomonas hominis]|uniref:hypothetical protein n=1 Tax=Cellulomonas hominis TaxID=156981 RepID=UPI001B913218|nr:hypothetical protein [Cellulomonas hominis]VTR76939.1 hypothetical protein CHMI_01707 [Cellulomonas hominis]
MAAPHRRAPSGPRTPAARLVAGTAALLVAGGVLAGCSVGADPSAAADAGSRAAARTAVTTGADCLAPQVLTALGFDGDAYAGATAHPDAPAADALPADFTAVSAVLCSTGETLTDGAGRWAAVTASRLEGDVAPLVDALSAGTTPAASSSPGACAEGAPRSDLWLVDALGAAVRVALPGDGCGPLPDAVADGLAALEAVDVEHYPVELVDARATASPTAG